MSVTGGAFTKDGQDRKGYEAARETVARAFRHEAKIYFA